MLLPTLSRRAFAAAAASLLAAAPPTRRAAALSNEEALKLEAWSRTAEGTLLPSGVRVIDVLEGTGPTPSKGDRVYIHYKIYSKAFDSGEPVDASYFRTRPVDFVLGSPGAPLERASTAPPMPAVLAGVDLGVTGMREGGWRRLVVPASLAYGDDGLRTKSSRQIKPGESAFVDVRLMDGGSGRCDAILRGQGMRKSVSCERGKP